MAGKSGFVHRMIRNGLARMGLQVTRLNRAGPHAQRYLNGFMSVVIEQCQRGAAPLTFIQVGGYDGVSDDPIHTFITRYRWRGVICEPQPTAFQMLQRSYQDHPQVHLENVAVGPERGSQTLYYVERNVRDLPGWAYQLSSFSAEHISKHLKRGIPDIKDIDELIRSMTVECVPLQDLIVKHGLTAVDLLQIDTEGYDFEILKSIDFSVLRPTVIRYEHLHLSRADKAESARLLIMQNYQLVSQRTDTIAFLPDELARN
jgi:FkbM family methyltransferase